MDGPLAVPYGRCMAQSAAEKENEKLESRIESKDRKLARIDTRGMFVGGVIGGAALGAIIDARIGTLWGFIPSNLVAAVAIGLVLADKIPRKNEDLVLALGLGMAAKPVYDKAVETMKKGLFGGMLGGGEAEGE